MEQTSCIYVAGHLGMLGSAVKKELEKQGYGAIVTRSRQEMDLTDQSAVDLFFKEVRPEYIFMCAAKVGGIMSNASQPAQFFYQNMQMQLNVMENARRVGVKKLLFVGSSCIYPKHATCPISEDQLLTGPFEPTNEAYALAKVGGVRMAQYYRREYGCDFISALPTNLYGPGDRYDAFHSHLLPAFILKAHRLKMQGDKNFEIWGTGTPLRELMYSEDCARALILLMKKYSAQQPINVGTGQEASILDIAETVCRVLDLDATFYFNADKPDGTQRKVLEVSRLHSLGFKSEVSLTDGIQLAYQDFLQRKLGS